MVTASFMVFLLPDPPAAVARWATLLRPGGRVAVSTFAELDDAGLAFYRDRSAALRPFQTPDPEMDRETSDGSTMSRGWVEALFGDSGLVDVTMTEMAVRSVYPTADAYWDWMLSAGSRRQLERIPPDREPEARAALADVLDRHLRQPDGGYAKESGMRITVARTPSPDSRRVPRAR
ncbi:hypothetical protein SAMN05421812_105374 [Asanoa hainanensis]|uniref:Methyltransferase domain-containing protein n=1 Tax=Asanoa hainanensis TaxID=560556 RepID=A0A239MFA8_9ACTN|nr:hypothetical protein SAMN05421812_105374 [Asanoa hainanensis]